MNRAANKHRIAFDDGGPKGRDIPLAVIDSSPVHSAFSNSSLINKAPFIHHLSVYHDRIAWDGVAFVTNRHHVANLSDVSFDARFRVHDFGSESCRSSSPFAAWAIAFVLPTRRKRCGDQA